MKKRILSIILTVALLVCMIPLGSITISALNWEGIQGNRLNESWFGTKDGMYILLSNGDSSGQWSSINRIIEIKEGVTVTIDMNGSILKSNVDGPLFDVYGTLILKNAGENNSHPAQAVLERFDNETNKSNLITVHSVGRVDIIDSGDGANGIDIKNSHSDSYGGAVFVIGNNGVGGTFNLYDPKTQIYNCDENVGGGVLVQGGATFNMYAGKISGCKATNSVDIGGGGVFNDGTFNMYGGTISGCSSNLYGGGVFNRGTFNMYGGTIDGCKSVNGGGVLNKGTFNMYGAGTYNSTTTSGAVIKNCESTGQYGLGGAIFAGTNSTTVIDGGVISGCKSSWFAGGVYQTDASVVTLKSGTVSNCSASGNGGGFYTDHRATLNITGGEITGCTSGNNGGGVFLVRNNNDKDQDTSKYTTLNMSGGTISDCTTNMHGGGVCVTQLFGKVKFNMTGGKIENCTSTNGNGGGVSLHNSAEFIMSGGTVQGNKTLSTTSGNGMGGGVYDDGTFTMSNGTIQNNSASRWGGGVQVYTNGNLTMTGGWIINNTAVNGAGGINCNKTATISNATITGNKYTGGDSNNNGHQLRIDPGKATITIKDYCTIDNGTNDLSGVTNNITKTAITFDKQGGNGGSDSVDPATYNSGMPKVAVPTKENSVFLGYYDAVNGGTKYYNDDGTSAETWNKIVASTTLYAQWHEHSYIDGVCVCGYVCTHSFGEWQEGDKVSYRECAVCGYAEAVNKETDAEVNFDYDIKAFENVEKADDVEFRVEKKNSASTEAAALRNYVIKNANQTATVFDISAYVNNVQTQINSGYTVRVKVKIPDGYKNIKVFYIPDVVTKESDIEQIENVEIKDGYAFFDVTHFSDYAITGDLDGNISYEYYLVEAPTIVNGNGYVKNGLCNQRSYYINSNGKKVIVEEKLLGNGYQIDFAGWYLRTFAQCKTVDGTKDVRLISMLNGDCFDSDSDKLLDYDYAGFEIQIDGKEVSPAKTNIANTSFLANGKEIFIADYSRETDFFFLASTVFAKELVEANAEITATPFVTLDDGTTIKGKTVSFKLGDLK